MDFSDNWLLTLGTFLPLVGVLVMLFIPRHEEKLHKEIAHPHRRRHARASASGTLASSTTTGPATLQFVVDKRGSTSSSRTTRSASTASACRCYVLSMFVTFLVRHLLVGPHPRRRQPQGVPHADAGAEVGMAGTFIAQDLILFFVFFEVVLLPMYFMIGVWGGEQRQYASLKFFLFTMFGSALMLRGVPGAVLQDRRRRASTFALT